MRAPVLERSFYLSITVHLLLLLMIIAFSFIPLQIRSENDAISIDSISTKSNKNSHYLSKKSKNGRGPSRSKTISVSDLGVKISTQQWTSHVLDESVRNGDYSEGLEEDTSVLSTKEATYQAYFKRVHDQLYRAWEPILLKQTEMLYNTGRLDASQPDFVTKTLITISPKGEILKVQLLQKSGVVELDSAALVALNEAGPYPNPPHGLIDESGNIHLPWDFILRN